MPNRRRWVFDPDSGGVSIPPRVRLRATERILRCAENEFAGHYKRLDVRFRGKFCYVDAFVEPEALGPNWPPPDWHESREQMLERVGNTPVHLCRLRYFGNEDGWGFAFFTYSHERYELAMFPSNKFLGPPEDAFRVAAGIHLFALSPPGEAVRSG